MDRNPRQRLAESENAALGYEDKLFRVALRLVKDHAHAEELTQKTYLQAWRYVDRFKPGTNLRAYGFVPQIRVVPKYTGMRVVTEPPAPSPERE
jgi:DNA-directed RNA polymerase specialized sigma24 family protein